MKLDGHITMPGQGLLYRQLPAECFMTEFNGELVLLDVDKNKFSVFSIGESRKIVAEFYFGMPSENIFEENLCQMPFGIEFSSYRSANYHRRDDHLSGVNADPWTLKEEFLCGPRHGWSVITAILVLYSVHETARKDKLVGLMAMLRRDSSNLPCGTFNRADLIRMIRCLNVACLLFPKKTKCLEWAVAAVNLARKRGYNMTLKIGVQTSPFYAHAWVEVDGDPLDGIDFSKCLSVIYSV